MANPPLYILVRLWIHKGRETEFEAYESKMARIMARYSGVIELAMRPSGAPEEPFEIHVIKFPSRDLYDAYLGDPERRSLSGERAAIITNSDILVGTSGPTYG